MSYDDKMGQIRALIEQFNAALDEADRLAVDEILKKIKKAGAVNEETLQSATWEDFEKAGLPRILARRVAELARVTQPGEAKFVTSKRAERMTLNELVEAYNPDEAIEGPVTTRLKSYSSGKRCLVLNDDNTVDVETTVALLTEVSRGYAEREVYETKAGKLRVPLRFGDKTDAIADENPVFRGEALRPDGTCQRTNLSWAEVPLEVRQLVYLVAIDPSLSPIASPDIAMKLHDYATEGKLQKRYQSIAAKLAELEKLGKAPALKVSMRPVAAGKNDPFAGGVPRRN